MSASDFFKKLQPLFESAELPKQEVAEFVSEGEAAMARKYAKFLKESDSRESDYIRLLNDHDWYFNYSESDEEAQRGFDEHKVLLKMANQLDPKFETWNSIAPDGCKKFNRKTDPTDAYDDFGLDEEVVTELSPLLKKRTSDKRIERFQHASDKWEEHNSEPNLYATDDENNPYADEVEKTFSLMQRNLRLTRPKHK